MRSNSCRLKLSSLLEAVQPWLLEYMLTVIADVVLISRWLQFGEFLLTKVR